MASTESRLSTYAYPVDDLVDLVRAGQIRIPSFQRGLRWTRGDVIKLFDSIVHGYPIGNLLLWRKEADASPELTIGALRIDAPRLEQALYVVDGQQRLTSLSNALTEEGHADPRFALAYDVIREQFVPAPSTAAPASVIPLPVIFDLSRLLSWYSDHPELVEDAELVGRSNQVAKAIREFRVPVYVVDQSDPNVLRDIFDRMNNYGKQLTRAEVFSALHETGSHEGDEHTGMTDLTEIAFALHAATGYGIVDDNTILLATLARRGPDVSRDIRKEFAGTSEEFPDEGPGDSQVRTQQALIDAVRFLQEEAHAPHFAFLPYRYLLVVLARFFAHFPNPAGATKRNLRRWFWRAATMGPDLTRGNITYATRALCAKIDPTNEVGSVRGLLSLVEAQPNAFPDVREFRTNWAETRLVVAALWDRRPWSFSTLAPYTLDELLTALGEGNTAVLQTPQVFRSSTLPPEVRSYSGNRIMLAEPAGLAPEDPAGALKRIVGGFTDDSTAAFLQSHLVSAEAQQALAQGNAEGFIRARQAAVMGYVKDFLSRQAEWAFEDTPTIRDLEVEDEPRDDDLTIAMG